METKFKIADFLGIYPEINKLLASKIAQKEEFNELKLARFEEKPKERGQYLKHQLLLSRYISKFTSYDNVLLFHEAGTGKTCSSVAVIEELRKSGNYKGALIIVKGPDLIKNYKNELSNVCSEKFMVENESELTAQTRDIRRGKLIEKYYRFMTYGDIKKGNPEQLKLEFSNSIIVIDEVHNLRLVEVDSKYDNIFKFLHSIEYSKILLMSGTPMVDGPEEIATVLNLILPINFQLPIGLEFKEKYLDNNEIVKNNKKQELMEYFYGRISYLRSMQSDVKFSYQGTDYSGVRLKILEAEEFQNKTYNEIRKKESEQEKAMGIFPNSQQASLFVFPNGKTGKEGFQEYVDKIKKSSDKIVINNRRYRLRKNFDIFQRCKNNEEKLTVLRKYSAKFADVIEKILKTKGNQFVYMNFVDGGTVIFSLILEQFGFKNVETSGESKNSYGLLSSRSDINKIIEIQNKDSNVLGEKLKVVIGSPVVKEGFTLKNIQAIYVLSPDWNFSSIDQVIARGIRLFSHTALLKQLVEFEVKIYLYCLKNTIDEKMYEFATRKDKSIKSMENLIITSSYDCLLNKVRNKRNALDYSRDCNYTLCDYVCENTSENTQIDFTTYNLYYSETQVEKIISAIKKLFLSNPSEFRISLKDTFTSIVYDDGLKIEEKKNSKLFIKALHVLIDEKSYISPIGIKQFFFVSGDYIYKTNFINSTSIYDSYYSVNTPLMEYSSLRAFNEKVEERYNKNIENIMQYYKNNCEKILQLDPLKAESFLEVAYEASLQATSLQASSLPEQLELARKIIDLFSGHLQETEEGMVSTYLKENDFGEYRIFTESGWKDYKSEKLTLKKQERIEEFEKKSYYGFYQEDKFKIKDNTVIKKEHGNSATKGKVCSTYKKSELINIILTLNIPIDVKNYKDSKQVKEPEKYEIDYTDLNQVRKLVYLQKITVVDLCKIIETYFSKENLLL